MAARRDRLRRPWMPVVFAADCDEDGNCPVCRIDYGECACPGPTQDDLYEYREVDGVMWARPKVRDAVH
jgi:hypothetical protein